MKNEKLKWYPIFYFSIYKFFLLIKWHFHTRIIAKSEEFLLKIRKMRKVKSQILKSDKKSFANPDSKKRKLSKNALIIVSKVV